MCNKGRLEQQIEFLQAIDTLKTVWRQTLLLDGSRRENDAEHSWHLALAVLVLSEHGERDLNLFKALQMVLIHDIVEIDAGDTFFYDQEGQKTKKAREQKAARRLFGLLPQDQGKEFRQLWQEFEDRQTPESRFARALDRFMPLLHNYLTQGKQWKAMKVTYAMARERNQEDVQGVPALWEYMETLLDQAKEKGYFYSQSCE